ncbi:hypothetical protein DBZ45_21470 [Arthrobacter globiformis]|uniref:Polysaccharide biosynthesis protein n=2 Tax=Arthrobacter globiformis TaxID=1665 RepID=A0A328H9B0_ARTGO|nr:hypothetical protein DBZ45_21470 [Arthrobacter globiformis]
MGALLVQPFSIRILDATQWGRVGLSAVLLQVGQVVLSAGLPLAITRAYFGPSEGPTHARAINGANIILSLTLSVLAAVGYFVLEPDRDIAITISCAILATGLLSSVVSTQAILRSQGRALAFVLLSGGASLLSHLAGLLAISYISPDSATYMAAFVVGMLATAIAGMALAPPLWPSKAKKAVRSAFRLGLPVLPHSFAIMLLMQGDTFLVQHFQDSESAGRYVAAAAFALGPFAILSGLNNVWTARILEASHGEHLGQTVRKVGNQTALVGGAIAIGASAAATLGMLVLKGEDHQVTQLAKVLPGAACGYALYLVAMSVMFARQKTSAFTWVTPLLLVAGTVVAVIPAQGEQYWLLGAVKAATFAGLGMAYCILAARMLPGFIPIRSFAAAAMASTVVIAANFLLPTTVSAGIVSAVLAAAAAAAGFFVLRKRGLASW